MVSSARFYLEHFFLIAHIYGFVEVQLIYRIVLVSDILHSDSFVFWFPDFFRSVLDFTCSKGKESAYSAGDTGDTGLIPQSGKSPGEGNGQPTPVFWPGESHGQRSLAG